MINMIRNILQAPQKIKSLELSLGHYKSKVEEYEELIIKIEDQDRKDINEVKRFIEYRLEYIDQPVARYQFYTVEKLDISRNIIPETGKHTVSLKMFLGGIHYDPSASMMEIDHQIANLFSTAVADMVKDELMLKYGWRVEK